MTAGKVEITNLESVLKGLDDVLEQLDDEVGYNTGFLKGFRANVYQELEAQKKHNEWKDLVAYWQDGTVCEVKFEGFRINKAGKIEMTVGEQWGTYFMGGYFASSETSEWYTQDLRFKEHRWVFRIWFDRQDPDGWPLVEVA